MKPRNKLIVSSLTLVATLGIVGSISSSVAWFQYVTSVRTAYTGTTITATKVLSMSVDEGRAYAKQLDNQTLKSHTIGGNNFAPVTTGPQSKNTELGPLYLQPDYQKGLYPWQNANPEYYASFSILLRVDKVDDELTSLTNDIYLTDLTIVDAVSNGADKDLSNAVRVHIKAEGPTTNNYLFAKNATSTVVGGYLDLNNDGDLDRQKGYEFEFPDGNIPLCEYGEIGAIQESYSSNDSSIFPTSVDGDLSGGTPIGIASENPLRVTVTIWIEGWAFLNLGLDGNGTGSADTPVWDNSKYYSNTFHVGMEFGVKLYSEDDSNQI